MAKCEVIVEVLAEGGSITLYGIRNGPGWIFARSVNDFTPELVDEDTILHKSARVESWGAALGLLDKYRWYSFYQRRFTQIFESKSGLLCKSGFAAIAGHGSKLIDGEIFAPVSVRFIIISFDFKLLRVAT